MPDDDDDFEVHMVPISPEQVEAMKKVQDQHMMIQETMDHDMRQFFGEMKPEQLVTMRRIMAMIADQRRPRVVAAYYEGVAAAILTYMHDLCVSCGVDHAAEFLNDAKGDGEGT